MSVMVARMTDCIWKTSGRPGRGCHWTRDVTETSHALDLEDGVFTWEDPVAMAASLARSAEASDTRKAAPYRSAMSMLDRKSVV